MLSKDTIASFFVSFISLGLGIALILFTPSIFTYILSALLIAISIIIIVLKYVFAYVKSPEPMDIV